MKAVGEIGRPADRPGIPAAGAGEKRMVLLTQQEVAEWLRISTATVKNLRLAGKLSYIPGRPVLILESDVAAYLESVLIAKAAKTAGTPEFEAAQRAKYDAESRKRIKLILFRESQKKLEKERLKKAQSEQDS